MIAKPENPRSLRRATLALLCATMLMPATSARGGSSLEFVQTWPIGAPELRDPIMRDAHVVWLEMIGAARSQISLAHFYASDREGSRLGPVVRALQDAASRGVKVRFLSDQGFYRTYPETLDRLSATEGIEMRLWDLRSLTGGVLHAKYMTVDQDQVFVGSQNFDWRALEHIQELGAHVVSTPIAADYQAVFDQDWRRAAGETLTPSPKAVSMPRLHELHFGDAPVVAGAVFSPRDLLPDGQDWDLPRIVQLLDSAESSIGVQLLNYKAIARDHSYWPELETALRAAAARGVAVRLLVSHWSQRRGTIEGMQSLQCLQNIEVRILTPPLADEGFLPFARVIHAKYAVVDGRAAWVGTSNWQQDYFYNSRNAGLMLHGEAAASALTAYFDRNWSSPYASTVDPGREYAAPRVSE